MDLKLGDVQTTAIIPLAIIVRRHKLSDGWHLYDLSV